MRNLKNLIYRLINSRIKNCKFKIILFGYTLIVVPLFLYSCETMDEENPTQKPLDFQFDENNFSFNMIDLWGSPAAAIDMGEYYIFQGDIFINKTDIADTTKTTRGAARLDKKWPNNKVYYTLEGFSDTGNINSAMKEIEENSYIKFVPNSNVDYSSDYVRIILDESTDWVANSNYIGKKGGAQTIHLSSSAYASKGTIMHELCHILGLYHEMCRTDRDNYIKIDFSKLSSDESYQFKKYKDRKENGADVSVFDYESIMMYSSYINGKLVMTKLNGDIIYSNRSYLTSTDMLAIAKAQPVVNYTFYSNYIDDGHIDDDYIYQRTKYLRCPEGAQINFKFQQLFKPANSSYSGYSLDDFNINGEIVIVNKNGVKIYDK